MKTITLTDEQAQAIQVTVAGEHDWRRVHEVHQNQLIGPHDR